MFREFVSSAGAFQRTDQNKNAGREADYVKQENKGTNVHPEAEQRVDNQKECEQNHSKFLHVDLLQRFEIFDQIPFLVFG